MTDHSTVPILRTKLYRPPVTADLLDRAELTGQLDAGRPLSLTLVSAPAGYGKSTIVSQWLENIEVPSTWLSLEESDGDIGIFLRYSVAAIRALFPDSCAETTALLTGSELPPANVLGLALCNDIDTIGESFILVLDEYHRVSSPEVHELLDELLQYPPRNLNLVIISRRNPPLSLSSFRSRNQVTEIRMQVLQFSSAESIAYLQHALGDRVDAVDLARIHDATEGWPAGLGIAAIALRQGRDAKEFISGLMDGSSRIQTYLIEDVLSHQSVSIKENLYRISILERFNAPLCEAVCTGSEDEFNGEQFITSLLDAGLLCIALDGHGEWYRLHQLFRDLLRAQLVELVGDAEVTRLHVCASYWLAGSGLEQEAVQHFVASNNIDAAVEYMASIRHGFMSVENWLQLSRLLSFFTAEQIEQYAVLLLIRAWINLHYLYDVPAFIKDVKLLERILETKTDQSDLYPYLKSELDALRALLLIYYVRAEEAVDLAGEALKGLGPEQESARGVALMALGAGYQLGGHYSRATDTLWDALRDAPPTAIHYQGRLLITLCFIHWAESNLHRVEQVANELLELSQKHSLPGSESYARYFLGEMYYSRNDIAAAIEQVRPIAGNPYRYQMQNVAVCSMLLGLSYQVMGQGKEARQVAKEISALALERRNRQFSELIEAFTAELDFFQGRIAEAERWAQQEDPKLAEPFERFFVPSLVRARVLLARQQEGDAEDVERSLENLEQFFRRTHDHRHMIDLLILKGNLSATTGRDADAIEALGEAVEIALPNRIVRPFMDAGAGIAGWLNRLNLDDEGLRFVGQILAEIGTDASSARRKAANGDEQAPAMETGGLVEALTDREREILGLMSDRLSNKEIGEKLFISPSTVKRHTINIYEKLAVHGRREAVSKATGLGIL